MELDTLHIIGRLGQHQFLEELAARITEASEAAKAAGAGAKAKVNVSFEVICPKDGPHNGVVIRESIDMKLPNTHVVKGSFFFVGEEGGLFDRDPTSPELPAMRAVENEAPVVRDAGQADAVRRAE